MTASLLISTIHRSPHLLLSFFLACCLVNSRTLTTASNSCDPSASRPHVVAVRRISRKWTHSAGMEFSLYSLGTDPRENTASKSPFDFMGGCLAVVRISLTCYWPLPRNACSFSRSLHNNSITCYIVINILWWIYNPDICVTNKMIRKSAANCFIHEKEVLSLSH
jgi:hypothetical protein